MNCNDQNPCTTDSCDGLAGCQYAANSESCPDNNKCTTGKTCVASQCTSGSAVICNDNNSCTDDSCAPASGCVYQPNAAGCSDGDACTDNDKCAGGVCTAGTAKNCNDSKVCTTDTCSKTSGCSNRRQFKLICLLGPRLRQPADLLVPQLRRPLVRGQPAKDRFAGERSAVARPRTSGGSALPIRREQRRWRPTPCRLLWQPIIGARPRCWSSARWSSWSSRSLNWLRKHLGCQRNRSGGQEDPGPIPRQLAPSGSNAEGIPKPVP